MAAVTQDWEALYHASADMKNDKDVVLVAVRQNGLALNSASAELKDDKVVVTAAVKQKRKLPTAWPRAVSKSFSCTPV